MEERIVNLLRLCLQAKDCGIHVFFNYQPHVNWIDIRVYKDGWRYKLDENGDEIYNEKLRRNEIVKPEKDLTISLKDEDAGEQIDEIYGYISNLIVEKSSQELAFQESQE